MQGSGDRRRKEGGPPRTEKNRNPRPRHSEEWPVDLFRRWQGLATGTEPGFEFFCGVGWVVVGVSKSAVWLWFVGNIEHYLNNYPWDKN